MINDLQWSDAIYGAGAGIFFLGYFFFEVPSNLLLQKIGAKKTIMRITIGWGLVCVLMAWVTTPMQFYILRFLMGAFEAGLQPGVILYLTFWLPTHRRGKALAFFVSASAISLMLGSPIELAAEDKALGPREHNIWASLRNPKLWVLIMVYFCVVAGNATLVYYGPSIVREVGFKDIKQLGWVMAGIYGCGWLGMVCNGWLSDRNKEIRFHTAIAAAIGATGLLPTAYFLGEKNLAGVVFSLALSSAGTMGAIPVFWQMPGRLLSGTAIAVGLALINSIANLAGYFSPQLLGYLKTTTGQYSQGLTMIACVEFVATALIIFFVAKHKVGAMTTA